MFAEMRHKALLALPCMLLALMLAACGGETAQQDEKGPSGSWASVIDRTVPTAEQGLNGNT